MASCSLGKAQCPLWVASPRTCSAPAWARRSDCRPRHSPARIPDSPGPAVLVRLPVRPTSHSHPHGTPPRIVPEPIRGIKGTTALPGSFARDQGVRPWTQTAEKQSAKEYDASVSSTLNLWVPWFAAPAATTLFSIGYERGCRCAASHGTRRINIDDALVCATGQHHHPKTEEAVQFASGPAAPAGRRATIARVEAPRAAANNTAQT